MRELYYVCYDAIGSRQQDRLLALCKGSGFHVQYSGFLCWFTHGEVAAFIAEVEKIIDPKKDDVRIYPVPSYGTIKAKGRCLCLPEGVEVFMNSRNIQKDLFHAKGTRNPREK